MKKWIWLAALLLLVTAVSSYVAVKTSQAAEDLKLYVDGELLQSTPGAAFINGTSYVPLRAVSTMLDTTVEWDQATETAIISGAHTHITISAGQDTAHRNGKVIQLSAPALLKHDTLMVPVRFVSEAFGAEVNWNAHTKSVSMHTLPDDLPVVGSYAHLKTLLEEAHQQEYARAGMAVTSEAAMDTAGSANAVASEQKVAAPAASGDFSQTNVQVQGVDEADTVKTDGQYIYQVNQGEIVIAKAYPAEDMSIVSTIDFDDQTFNINEVYVDDKYLVAIGSGYHPYSYDQPMTVEPMQVEPMPAQPMAKMIYPPRHVQQSTKAMIYTIEDKANPELIREVEIEGNYVSSRKVGSSLYLVANQYIDVYRILNEETESDIALPAYRDSAVKDEFSKLDYEAIRYFPDSQERNYLLIGGLDLDNPEQELNVSAYLGSSQNIYASTEHLYTAVTQYERVEPEHVGTTNSARVSPRTSEAKTIVYKFGLHEGIVHYKDKGEVPGSVLNQFSMDEHEGYFRIATSKGNMWSSGEQTSKNQLYVLNRSLDVVGSIEDIAPGERIYSARFMGDRAYMVTFRTVDPLFVIDLKDPEKPAILGSLKIPGYSDYLHPYDENHIIGFGKDTIEVSRKDHQGNTIGTTAYYQGMKIALFDVSNVANPKEKFKLNIGDRGTESELLHNHKALMFSKAHNLMAFPITLMEVPNKEGNSANSGLDYGQFTFQGAMVYSIDLEQGFELKAQITHLSEDDMKKAGQHWYDPYKSVQRILYIGDRLFTLSPSKIKASDIQTFKAVNELDIPQKQR